MKPRPPERDYSHRGVLDKLGVKPGLALAVDDVSAPLDSAAAAGLADQLGRDLAADDEPLDLVLATVDADVDLVAVLNRWRPRLDPRGGIWLLTPKRKFPGYLPDTAVIEAGLDAGLVDNKVCSVSDRTSGTRFVIRRADRQK
jgi:hypothetical protein